MIVANNLYQHADGGFYCLLSDDAPFKSDQPPFNWLDGVIYTATDGKLRSTTKARWRERFTRTVEYHGDDEEVMMMIRRTNPGDPNLDFVKVFESWHESEMGIVGHALEMSVAAALVNTFERQFGEGSIREGTELRVRISTEDLQRVINQFEIEKVAEPHAFTFIVRK